MPTQLIHGDVTDRILRAYFTAYNRLGKTYPEYIFERAVILLLERQGTGCVQQDEYEIRYKGFIVGLQRLDVFVAEKVVVELKVANAITSLHLAQLLSYMKTVNQPVGLLLRFGGPKPDFARRILSDSDGLKNVNRDLFTTSDTVDLLYPDLTHQILNGLFEVYKQLGPGFIHRIYANACYYELKLCGLDIKTHREFHVFMDDIDLGVIKFGHLQIDSRVLVFPVAVADIATIQINNLKAWMRYLNIPIGIVMNFSTIHPKPLILRV